MIHNMVQEPYLVTL